MGQIKIKIHQPSKEQLSELVKAALRKYGTTYKEREQEYKCEDFKGLSFSTVYHVSLGIYPMNANTFKILCDCLELKVDSEHYRNTGEFKIL